MPTHLSRKRLQICPANAEPSVHYEMPQSIHIHKSMLLRGLNMPPAVLERADLETTKSKAANSGRSFGGVPFRGERHGGGRGGRFNYAENPFKAHMDPNFAPPANFSARPPGHASYQGARGNDAYPGPPAPHVNQYIQSQPAYGRPPAPPQGYGSYIQPPPAPPPYHRGSAGGYGSQYPSGQYQHR